MTLEDTLPPLPTSEWLGQPLSFGSAFYAPSPPPVSEGVRRVALHHGSLVPTVSLVWQSGEQVSSLELLLLFVVSGLVFSLCCGCLYLIASYLRRRKRLRLAVRDSNESADCCRARAGMRDPSSMNSESSATPLRLRTSTESRVSAPEATELLGAPRGFGACAPLSLRSSMPTDLYTAKQHQCDKGSLDCTGNGDNIIVKTSNSQNLRPPLLPVSHSQNSQVEKDTRIAQLLRALGSRPSPQSRRHSKDLSPGKQYKLPPVDALLKSGAVEPTAPSYIPASPKGTVIAPIAAPLAIQVENV